MKTFSVRVKPNSKQQAMRHEGDGSLTVQLRSPPIDGKANEELIQLLADAFDVPKSAICMLSGITATQKRIEIDD